MSLTANDIDTMIAGNVTIIEDFQTQLKNDAALATPLMTYSFRGQTLNRNEWKVALADIIMKLIATNEKLQSQKYKIAPYIITLRKRVI